MAVHPGEILMDRVLIPSGISIRQAASQLAVSADSLSDVIAGKKPVVPELAYALSREFSYSCQWWIDLQNAWDQERRCRL